MSDWPFTREDGAASRPQLMVEVIRTSLGNIAREASVWPPTDKRGTEARIIAAVTDASVALRSLEETLGLDLP